ncbi:glycosyltransferase [Fibrobacter sp. UWB13]|uniref:glycosyltransferase n=1 Tax=Fibrobacter sp. UWB13 TaxID=1896204 RepID=UPI000A0E56A5|nr:glycosyltransferase [Fibrobacter sp. UWB13]SMG30113.1 Glycosyltransferase involved in cell wall bisynthesis [Fibrobacter sp. UWB13]
MKVAILHGSNQGFFPRFYRDLKSIVESNEDNEVKLFVPNSGLNHRCVLPNQVCFGSRFNWHLHYGLFKFFGKQDCWSHLDTWDLIRKLKKFKPDILHFHVVNQCHINFPMLIRYVNKNHIPVVWTFHDCRAFTGGCPYFDEIKCERWKDECRNCPDKGGLYIKNFANTEWLRKFREEWFNKIWNLHIVTPSQWLADFVKQSFFKTKNVQVIYNGIDIDAFSSPSDFDVYGCYGIDKTKKIVLGCAINWEPRKGLVYFEELAKRMSSDYQIVLVGGVPQSLKSELEKLGILCTGRTRTFAEMVAWYQVASVFVNPTLADNFPTVNIEALASGTPVVMFKTGGSPEAVDECTGIVVEQCDVEGLLISIDVIISNPIKYSREKCLKRSHLFSKLQYKKYLELYHSVIGN